MTDDDTDLEVHANELYWSSDESVNTIADELDLSKGTLYNVIQPLPTGLACPECGAELEYPNRTARERGLVACPHGDFEGELEEGEALTADSSPAQGRFGDSIGSAVGGLLDSSELGRTRTLVGGALLGAAAGLALVFWTRRR